MTIATSASTGTADTENTMQAIVQRAYGSSDTLGLTEIARPEPGPGQVLIEVHAAGADRGVSHLSGGLPHLAD